MDILRDFDKLPDGALVPAKAAWPLIGCGGRTSFWRRVRSGVYPKPFKISGGHVNYWTAGQIRQIQASATRAQAA